MSKLIKPLLAAKATAQSIQALKNYPYMVSPKMDGVRAIVVDGVVYSRTMKPIPNYYVQEMFGRPELNGIDGELIVGHPTHPMVYTNTTSGVMSREGKPDVRLWAFDYYHDHDLPFHKRLKVVESIVRKKKLVSFLTHTEVTELSEIEQYEHMMLDLGYEGIMLRSKFGPYKFGRSTMREETLMKLKRFSDSEAEILGYEELYINKNEKTAGTAINPKRSTNKAGMVPAGVLGAFMCKDVSTGVRFNIGSGLTEIQRKEFWNVRDSLVGKFIKYQYFSYGMDAAPRFPVFLGFRDPIDFL